MILMRHGDCYYDYPNDPELTALGRERVRANSNWLRKHQVDLLICSNKRRALQTTDELRGLFPTARHEIHPLLREIHPHALSDGLHDDAMRAASAFEQIVRPRFGQSVLLVAHQNILSYFCRRLSIRQSFSEFCSYAII